jgi:hypothetical protein
MASTATLNTMAEGLMKIAKDLTALMALPNADIDFLTELQTSVLGYVQHANTPNPSLPPPGPDNQLPGPPAPAGMPPEIAALMGGGGAPQGITPSPTPVSPVGNVASLAPPPNPDEMQRLLA